MASINMSDPYILRELTPGALTKLGQILCARWGRPPDAFGAQGNGSHRSGYHRSREWILRSVEGSGPTDYSVTNPLDQAGEARNVSAFDFTPGEWGTPANRAEMVRITKRMLAAAKAYDFRLSGLCEVAGTLDGTTVTRFRVPGGATLSPFDSSHLDHIHASARRGEVAQLDAQGIYEVMAGIPAGSSLFRGSRPMYLASPTGSGTVYLTDGIIGRWVNAQELPHLQALSAEGTAPLGFGGQIRGVAYQSMVGEIVGPRPEDLPPAAWVQQIVEAFPHIAAELTPAQVEELKTAIVDSADNPFTAEQVDQLVAADKRAAQEGTGSA